MTDDHLDRLRAWRQQLNADHRAWYELNGHPVPEPLHQADKEVPCRLGCGTNLSGPDGEHLPLLLADLDAALDEVEQLRTDKLNTDAFLMLVLHRYGSVTFSESHVQRAAEWWASVTSQQPKPECPCGCPVVEDMCSCPEPCPCEPDCAFCLVPNQAGNRRSAR